LRRAEDSTCLIGVSNLLPSERQNQSLAANVFANAGEMLRRDLSIVPPTHSRSPSASALRCGSGHYFF